MDIQATRDKVLLAALPHVPFDGWTLGALRHGVADAGLTPDMARRAFPGGMAEVAAHFSDYADRRMLAELEKRDLPGLRVRDRIATTVRVRLEQNAPHREAVRRLLSFLALPFNAGLAARCTWRTVSAMWYAAGDEATDFNFYTKRALLTPVYTTTVLYWLADDSEGFADTWGFLDRRIGDVMRIPGLTARLRKALPACPSPLSAFRAAAQRRE
ncbi:MAG: COQ9 family protein [Rhodospirillales bacterium]